MEPSLEDIAIQTLTSLESRLHRLEFLLHGAVPSRDANTESPANSQPTLSRRLKKVEEGVQKLQSSHPELIKLLWLKSRFPDLFEPASTSIPPPLPAQLSTLLAHAPLIHTTRSSLHALDALLPLLASPATLTRLLSAAPELTAARAMQRAQAAEIAALRQESAEVVWRWQEGWVIGQGACWAEWEERVGGVEGRVRRGERERGEGE